MSDSDEFDAAEIRFRVRTEFWGIFCVTCEQLYNDVFKLDEHEGHEFSPVDAPKFSVYGKGVIE